MRLIIIYSVFTLIFFSCSGNQYLISYKGDNVEIESVKDHYYEGELIAITDSGLVILWKKNYISIPDITVQ